MNGNVRPSIWGHQTRPPPPKRAIFIYSSSRTDGRQPSRDTRRPNQILPGRAEQPVTVGEFLDEVLRTASNQRTIEGYAKAFRQIVSQSFGLAAGTDKYDYRNGGQGKWLEKVHNVKLVEMTPARVQEWKRSFLAAAGNDPLELRRARISVNNGNEVFGLNGAKRGRRFPKALIRWALRKRLFRCPQVQTPL